MALPIRRLFLDAETNQVYRNFNDFSAAPTFYLTRDDAFVVDVVLVRQTGVPEFPMESLSLPFASYGSSSLIIGDDTNTAYSSTPSVGIPSPALTIGSITGSYYTFSIDQEANYGSFTLTLTKSSPALSVTTAPILYPFTTTDIETAVKNAINGAAGWSAATCTVIPTGGLSGRIKAGGTNSSTVYDLATSSCTMTTSSNLYGFSGLRFDVQDVLGNVDTYLGGASEKAATLQFTAISGSERQCFIQVPCVVRANII